MFFNLVKILYFAFCAINKTKININPENNGNKVNIIGDKNLDLEDTRNTGLDERVSKMSDIVDDGKINVELLANINENFYKQRVLKTLENDKISLIEKLEVLNRYLLYIHTDEHVNIFAGGLLDDWNFEIN